MRLKTTPIDRGLQVVSPAADEIHLYYGAYDPFSDQLADLEQLLSADEIERADRFRFPHLREKFVIAHGWLRSILGRAANTDPKKLRFRFNEYGKPAIADLPELHYNLSHTATTFLIGAATVGELGVDIECIRPVKRAAQIADRYFCPREAQLVVNAQESATDILFLQLWTLKEAWIKALGTGLATPLNEADTGYQPTQPDVMLHIEDCRLLPLADIPPEHCAAICWHDSCVEVESLLRERNNLGLKEISGRAAQIDLR